MNPPFFARGACKPYGRARLVLFVRLFKEHAEAVEALFPDRPVVRDPFLEGVETRRLDAAGANPAELLGVDEGALLEHLQMLDDRGKRDAERLGQR